MPELPEVETVRRDLAPVYVGHRLERLAVTGRRTVRRHPPDLLGVLEGRTLSQCRASWEVPAAGVGRRPGPGRPPPDERPAPGGASRRPPRPAYPRRDDLAGAESFASWTHGRSGSSSWLHQRRATGKTTAHCGAKVRAEAGRLAELDHLGPDALDVDVTRFREALAGRRAPLQVPDGRPESHRRHRQHLRRRNLL